MFKRKETANDKHVELCRLTNRRVSKVLMKNLIDSSIPFVQTWRRIPIYKRMDYNGAREICVITTHRSRYGQARRVLDTLDAGCKRRIQLHVV